MRTSWPKIKTGGSPLATFSRKMLPRLRITSQNSTERWTESTRYSDQAFMSSSWGAENLDLLVVAVMSLALAGRCLFPRRPSEYKKERPHHAPEWMIRPLWPSDRGHLSRPAQPSSSRRQEHQEPWSLSQRASVKTYELRPLSPIFELTTTSSMPSTGEEALLRPGSSFQSSHQDVLNHLKASPVSLRTQKTVPQPLYQIPKE